jgi:ornithine--oxo-acid transaminase/putrescine aminotransferase
MVKLTPRTAEQVLANPNDGHVVAKERANGNSDLIRALEIAGIAGPFRVIDPWRLEDPAGRTLINAGGYSALPFGERYPPLIEFLERYLRSGSSSSLPQQAASEWRAELEHRLVAKLASLAPSHADSRIFFSNSGAEAIESAVKFAAADRPDAPYFINFDRAYHGKTPGALSLTPNKHYQHQLRHLPLDVITLPYGDAEAFAATVKRKGAHRIAAVILEPIQGEAGVRVPEAAFLREVDRIAKDHCILVIADEIQTGLGRSGYWFASVEWGGMDPDIITLAKPLGGGLTATGATIARKRIYRRMLGGLDAKQQSNTFGGNALAMAIGLKSLDILEDERLVSRARELGLRGKARLDRIAAAYPDLIKETRAFGLLFALQFQPVSPTKQVHTSERLNAELTGLLALMTLHRGGIIGNFSLNSNRTIRLTPALTMPDAVLDELFDKVEAAAAGCPSSWAMLRATPHRTLLDLGKFALFG